MKNLLFTLLAVSCIQITSVFGQIDIEKVEGRCHGIAHDQRLLFGVSEFKFAAASGSHQVGSGLTDMLSNALVECGCFSVVERSRMDDLMDELSLGMDGTVSSKSAAQVGNLLGAQYLVMGTITEFAENESGGGAIGLLKKVGAGVGLTQAHVGLIIKVVEVETGQVILSKSIDKKVKKLGLIGGQGMLGLALAGAYKSKAMEDAIEEAIIETVSYFVAEKGIFNRADSGKPNAVRSETESTCPALLDGSSPTIMVVIPEVHIARRIPDPAGETEIIRKFAEKGFRVVDPTQIESIRSAEEFSKSIGDPAYARNLGLRFGADIIITGEAFSQLAGNKGNMFSCRARVEARAIDTKTGRIIAADGKHAAGADIAEFVAAKSALRNAGSELADYFLAKICEDATLASTGGNTVSSITLEILLQNANFMQVSELEKFLQKDESFSNISKTFQNNAGRFNLTGNKTSDQLAEFIMSTFQNFQLEITALDNSKVILVAL
ncbi:MAG: hypothetical protein KDC53_22710 [Saprospiraceae bacterium]|nr:hypothetical protein [Saprospiraceae bacterium]